jgi:hypothetical protein
MLSSKQTLLEQLTRSELQTISDAERAFEVVA